MGVIASDHADRLGLAVEPPSTTLQTRLAELIPPMGSLRNPIDLTGDVSPQMLADCINAISDSGEYDAVGALVMGVPGSTPFGNRAYADSVHAAAEKARARGLVVAVSWVLDEAGGAEIAAVRDRLHPLGIPVCPYPEDAIEILQALVERGRFVAGCEPKTPSLSANAREALTVGVARGIETLTEHATKALLEAAGVPVVPSRLVSDAEAAVKAADAIGYPVVLKVQSARATHKSDLGGVALNLSDAEAVRNAFERVSAAFAEKAPATATLDGVSVQPMLTASGVELLCGVAEDEQFGKFLTVGLGGTAIEVLDDVSVRLLPVGHDEIAEMLTELKAYPLLNGYRNTPPIESGALVETIFMIAALATQPELQEIETNPLFATSSGTFVVDARARLRVAAQETLHVAQ